MLKIWKEIGVQKILCPVNLSLIKVWLKLDWYQLRYSIIFLLGQMLHRQMLTVQMSPRRLTTHTDGLIIEFGENGIGISWDIPLYSN